MRELMQKARSWVAFLGVSVLLSACGDDDEPAGPAFTAETAEQTADAADGVVGPLAASAEVNANVWNAFGTLLFYGGGTVSPMVPFETARQLERSGKLSIGGLSARGMPAPSTAAPDGVLLPEEILGRTFAWDVATDQYVATEQTGAPSNGVRFIYYAIDPWGLPVEPLNALGHLQFVDASTATAARLEVEAVRTAGNVTLADYYVQGSVAGATGNTLTMESEGFVSDGSERADFDIDMVLSETVTAFTETTDVVIENAATGAALRFDYQSTSTEATALEEGVFVVEHGGDEAVFDFTGEFDFVTEEYSVEGELRYNGRQVVLFDGSGGSPEFTRPDGSDLTGAEVQALSRVWAAFGFTQFFVLDIVLPFYFLLLFSGA